MLFLGAVTIEREPILVRSAVSARLDPQQKLAVQELFPTFIEQYGIDAITKGITHARTDEDVFKAVRIEVPNADAPRPVSFESQPIGCFHKRSVALVLEK